MNIESRLETLDEVWEVLINLKHGCKSLKKSLKSSSLLIVDVFTPEPTVRKSYAKT